MALYYYSMEANTPPEICTSDEQAELDEPIKIRWTGDARSKLLTRSMVPTLEDGHEWPEYAIETMQRQKTNIVINTRAELMAFEHALDNMLMRVQRETVWMTAAHERAFERVHSDLIEAME